MKKALFIATVLCLLTYAGYYQYGLFTEINYFKAKNDIKNGKVQILTYGLPVIADSVLNSVAMDYGFEFNRIADCVITKRFVNQIKSYNAAVVDHLEEKHGADWYAEFEMKMAKMH